jgi:hypothetical protein
MTAKEIKTHLNITSRLLAFLRSRGSLWGGNMEILCRKKKGTSSQRIGAMSRCTQVVPERTTTREIACSNYTKFDKVSCAVVGIRIRQIGKDLKFGE